MLKNKAYKSIIENFFYPYGKAFAIGTTLFVVAAFLWNTHRFFLQFKKVEQQRMSVWATAQSQFLATDPSAPMGDLVLKIFQSNKETPMLLVQADGSFTFNNYAQPIPSELNSVTAIKNKYALENPPIEISEGGTVLATLYYGESANLKKLKYYPYGLLLVFGLFGGVLYAVFQLSGRSHRNILWASMAKETAHQIATPLSALLAWNELLKEQHKDAQIPNQIDKDLARLSMISSRFSTIGNKAVLEPTDLIAACNEGLEYLKIRMGNSVQIHLKTALQQQIIPLNKALFFWCLENLVKNGVDAMKGAGHIEVLIHKMTSYIQISIVDSGHGMSKRDQKRIFSPGYSSKKTGWGMGLSLAKRIVESYHGGKLFVGKSSEKGTEMVIQLPYNEQL